MKYRVNELCIACGLCAATCPDVYEMSETGEARAIDEDVPADVADLAREAMESCPVGAIEETD